MLSSLSYPLFIEKNRKLSLTCLDIVSDLHIDQWDPSLNIKNPCGEVVDAPFKFKKSKDRILVVAGDISDDIDISVKYLDDVSKNYERILFVDGNHEHVGEFPGLLSNETIKDKIDKLENEKIVYLPKTHYKLKDTVFVGFSGWWDYDKRSENSINEGLKYFENWIPKISNSEVGSRAFIENVIEKSEEQQRQLYRILDYYEEHEEIKNVVIVTHTIPLSQFALGSDGKQETSFQLQSNSRDLVDGRFKKLSKWIFGHTHNQFDKVVNNVHFIAHPRGRPEDFNREEYNLKRI